MPSAISCLCSSLSQAFHEALIQILVLKWRLTFKNPRHKVSVYLCNVIYNACRSWSLLILVTMVAICFQDSLSFQIMWRKLCKMNVEHHKAQPKTASWLYSSQFKKINKYLIHQGHWSALADFDKPSRCSIITLRMGESPADILKPSSHKKTNNFQTSGEDAFINNCGLLSHVISPDILSAYQKTLKTGEGVDVRGEISDTVKWLCKLKSLSVSVWPRLNVCWLGVCLQNHVTAPETCCHQQNNFPWSFCWVGKQTNK